MAILYKKHMKILYVLLTPLWPSRMYWTLMAACMSQPFFFLLKKWRDMVRTQPVPKFKTKKNKNKIKRAESLKCTVWWSKLENLTIISFLTQTHSWNSISLLLLLHLLTLTLFVTKSKATAATANSKLSPSLPPCLFPFGVCAVS